MKLCKYSINLCVCACAKSLQSCLTLCNPMDYSPPGSCVHGLLQARILEWVAISFSRGSSQPRDRTQVSRIGGRRFNLWDTYLSLSGRHKLGISCEPHDIYKESAGNAGVLGSIPESGRSPGEGNGNPLQYSRLGNPMDRGAWRTIVLGVTRVGYNLATKQQQQKAW